MGTLEYMAPEQTSHEILAVDTRADIFALGIVLYELITGMLPLPKEELQRRALDEVVAKVRGTPRPAPSTRFSSLTPDKAATAARQRGQSSPERMARTLSGRLRHLPGTALRLEKEHRFTSAAMFARDIRHYLDDEPFEEAAAEPLLRKLWLAFKRNPLPYVAAALILLSLVGGLTAATLGYQEAERQRINADSHRAKAETQRNLAQRRFDETRRIANSMLFDVHDAIAKLSGATPARRLLIQTGLQYLDALAAEASDDLTLLRDIAAGYSKMGDVQAGLGMQNLGDVTAALASYEKCMAILQRLAEADTTSATAQRDLLLSHLRLGLVHETVSRNAAAPVDQRMRGWREARAAYERALKIAEDMRQRGILARSDALMPADLKGRIEKCETAIKAIEGK